MGSTYVDEAIALIEKANASLQPELLTSSDAERLLTSYAKARKLLDFGLATLSRKVQDAARVAKVTGTSVAKAQDTVTTGKVLRDSEELSDALRHGDLSLDQASEIAKAEESAPGAAKDLVAVGQKESFQVLRETARKAKLEAEQRRDLAQRQRRARSGRSYVDELGMVHIHLALEPHVGAPYVSRAEADAQRLQRAAKKKESAEPFERHLADAYAAMLAGGGRGPSKRPELVVVVSYEVAKRGWRDVRDGEHCKIPGVGPIAPPVARDIARDAFLSGLIHDGTDLRQFKRWTRNVPYKVALALELGPPPEFDGMKCVDCGKRFRLEKDHMEPHCARGPASTDNLRPRCWVCHGQKTARDRRSGKLQAAEP